MTAATLQALAAELTEATLEVQAVTEQARLRGLTVETFGLTHGQERLISKLRGMGPEMRAGILTKEGTV
jgi:hypothetical protein